MFQKSKALIYPKANKLGLRELEHLPMGAEDVFVRTIATTVSPGLERLQLTGKSTTRRELKFPLLSGSELLGEVLDVGGAVEDLKRGDYVYVWRADKWFDALPVSGCQAERVLTDRRYVLPLSEPTERDLLIGLLAYAISAVRKIDLGSVNRVLMLGLGSVGLMLCEYLRYKGISAIDAVETFVVRGKLAAAQTIALNIEDFTAEYADRYDLIIEATGRFSLLQPAMRLLTERGTFLLTGSYESLKEVDYRFLQDKEPLLLLSSVVIPDAMMEAKYLLGEPVEESGFDADKFITHHFPISNYERAYEIALNSSDAVKTVLLWQ